MSRSSTAPRNLSYTEELEKLEQSITLTLQEIDHNFSKAHRIVTSSILPIVEQYGEHSRNVWEGSKFWKQFFEASANVSLSGYEEAALEGDTTYTQTTESRDSTFEIPQSQSADDDTITGHEESQGYEDDEEGTSMMDSPSNATGVHSTPQILGSTIKSRTRSPPPSHRSARQLPHRIRQDIEEPSTPRGQGTADMLDSSPFDPPSAFQPPTAQRQNDPLLHRVLDRNYRVQATPLTARREARRAPQELSTPATTNNRPTTFDSSPLDSSPAAPPPQLRSDLFSPAPASARKRTMPAPTPRTPGISVQQTPAQIPPSTGRNPFTTDRTQQSNLTARTPALWDSDSDEDDAFGMSPPKTMQFAVPQSRLLQTPAREASRRIVEELLMTAGAEATDEIEGVGEGPEEPSPSVVRRAWEDDDTF
ncbi:hypothetical protein MBLNU457_g2547t1 [Dothideomycetes sp. NU457]